MNVLVCIDSSFPGRASQAALRLATSLAESSKIIVLSSGDSTENVPLTLARQSRGVERVLRLQDNLLKKADYLTLGMVLAEIARYLEVSLIAVGERSDDEGQGLVPAAIAHHLRAPIMARVQSVHLSPNTSDMVEVKVRAGGCLCTVESPLPLVLVTSPSATPCTTAASEPTSLSIETLTLAQLGIDNSRMVPRPELLGTLVPAEAKAIRRMTCDDVAAALQRPR